MNLLFRFTQHEKAFPGKNGMKSQRNTSDYWTMLLLLIITILITERTYPNRSTANEMLFFKEFYDPFHIGNKYGTLTKWTIWWGFIFIQINLITWSIFLVLQLIGLQRKGATARTTSTFWNQMIHIMINFLLLPIFQSIVDYFIEKGYTKQSMDNFDNIFRDAAFWIISFEFFWYLQHRAMHDNKFLWHYGHFLHHQWKQPEHMIGITNFSFDHCIELWVTMSSASIGYFIFPMNFYVSKVVALVYMVLAIVAHWDQCPFHYHLHHHYLVTKNFGSHIPIFDILFGTYQWEPFIPSSSRESFDKIVE